MAFGEWPMNLPLFTHFHICAFIVKTTGINTFSEMQNAMSMVYSIAKSLHEDPYSYLIGLSRSKQQIFKSHLHFRKQPLHAWHQGIIDGKGSDRLWQGQCWRRSNGSQRLMITKVEKALPHLHILCLYQ